MEESHVKITKAIKLASSSTKKNYLPFTCTTSYATMAKPCSATPITWHPGGRHDVADNLLPRTVPSSSNLDSPPTLESFPPHLLFPVFYRESYKAFTESTLAAHTLF